MKAMAILSAAAFALLAFNVSPASSQQDICNNEYIGCMTACASRTVKAGQDTCFNSCETRNGMCAERIYGKRPFNGGAPVNTQASGRAKDAMAKDTPAPREQQEPAEQAARVRR